MNVIIISTSIRTIIITSTAAAATAAVTTIGISAIIGISTIIGAVTNTSTANINVSSAVS